VAIEVDDLIGSIEAEADAGDLVLDERRPGRALCKKLPGD